MYSPRHAVRNYKEIKRMSGLDWWMGLGYALGTGLFFVLERRGVVYEWFDHWDGLA